MWLEWSCHPVSVQLELFVQSSLYAHQNWPPEIVINFVRVVRDGYRRHQTLAFPHMDGAWRPMRGNVPSALTPFVDVSAVTTNQGVSSPDVPSGCRVWDWGTSVQPGTSVVYIEGCGGWWLSGCRSSVAEHWLHKPGVSASIPDNCRPFHFPLFSPQIHLISHLLSLTWTMPGSQWVVTSPEPCHLCWCAMPPHQEFLPPDVFL